MKSTAKRLISCVLLVGMLLAMCLPVSAAEAEPVLVASNTVTLKSGTANKSETVAYTPATDGILIVSMAAANPGWAFRVNYADGSGTLLISGKNDATYEYEISAGETVTVVLYAYDKAGWALGDGEISYEISFRTAEIQQEVVKANHLVSDSVLALGENALTMESGAVTTIFAFTPDQTGTYRFTADNAALLGYWGSSVHYLSDFTAEKTNTLEHTITSVGQRIMLGISGVDSCNVTVEKIADYEEVVIQTIVYENTHEFGTYTYDENAIVDIDIFDSDPDVAVLGADGFYHYGSAIGPVMVVNLKTIGVDVGGAYSYGQLTGYGTDENGVTVKYDYNNAMKAYYDKGLYPVTEELALMLQRVGKARSWYIPGGFIYTYASSVDEEVAWMGVCSYVAGTEETPSVPTLTLKYPTLAFKDEIQYNVYFDIANMSDIAEMGLLTFADRNYEGTIEDALEIISGYVANADGSYTVRSNGVPARMLGDTKFFKVYARLSDGTYVYSEVVGYHAVAYANTILNSATSSANAKALVVAMLNYGAAAQTYFGYKTDSLMNAGLTAEQQALVQPYDGSMIEDVVKAESSKYGMFIMNGGYTDVHPTVSFQGAFSINYYFTPKYAPEDGILFFYWDAETYANVRVLNPNNATGMVRLTSDNGVYVATVSGISARQIDETIYIAAVYNSAATGTAFYTPVIAYSLGGYCEALADKGNAFGAATGVYGYYAKTFFAN